jgi:hypothetical protein
MRPASLGLFAVTVALVALSIVATVASGGSPTTAPARPGLSYGALTPQGEPVWIRLRPDRKRIASLEAAWEAPAARCTHRQVFWSFTYSGGENGRVIPVTAGQFRSHVTDRYFEGTTAIVENFEIEGRIDAARAVGQFTVKVDAKRRDGTGYRCNVGPIPFTAVN